MRKLSVIFFFLWSCSTEKVPKDILPPEEMQAILYDVIRADELVDFSAFQDSTYRKFSKRAALYDSVLTLHKISKENFQKSFQYYQGRPDLLRTMLDSLQSKVQIPADTSRKVKPVLAK